MLISERNLRNENSGFLFNRRRLLQKWIFGQKYWTNSKWGGSSSFCVALFLLTRRLLNSIICCLLCVLP